MPNIIFKLGSLDLSAFVRVNPGDGLDPANADMLEPAFSDSPFFEGQAFTSLHAKNREQKWPLFLHPSQAPYLQDALNQLVQGINQQLRPIVDYGQIVNCQWQNAQASNPTFYTIQYGKFEPAFNFRQTEKGWLAGTLHLWTLPYGHTATQRSLGTYTSAGTMESSLYLDPLSLITHGGGTIVGDISPQFEILMTVGSYIGEDGRIGIISALPQASYAPFITIQQFVGRGPSSTFWGASGAWASQILALDNTGGSQGFAPPGTYANTGYFTAPLNGPASVYIGDNRVLGLVRARAAPFGLRAFDFAGNPIGPTVIASAMDGWQLVDYGVLRIPPWLSTAVVNIQAYPGIPYNASGMFSPARAAPAWTKEHGPIFVLPSDSTILDLDWNSPVLSMDGFDGASGAVIGQDMLGNTWTGAVIAGESHYNGVSGYITNSQFNAVFQQKASNIQGDFEIEGVFTIPSGMHVGIGARAFGVLASLDFAAGINSFSITNPSGALVASQAITQIPGQQWHIKVVSRGSQIYANLGGPSGAFAGSASGVVASIGGSFLSPWQPTYNYPSFDTTGSGVVVEAFRARLLASQGYQSRDILHLHQPNLTNTRANPSAVDLVDLQARQRGPIQAINLPVPSLGAGLFIASFPWDQGPANDLLNVDVRVRERFTYAR